jgi:3-isopropylmalate/(R)-2-methylmalate dehydratase large subunit
MYGDSHTAHTELLVRLLFGIELEAGNPTASCKPKPKKMRINVNGTLSKGVGPKDVALYIIPQLSTSGRNGLFC